MAGDLDSMTGACFFAALVSSLGSGFQHGYNTGVLNNINGILLNWTYNMTHANETKQCWADGDHETKWPDDVTWINAGLTSGYVFGGMIGGISTKLWLRLFGLKLGIILNNVWCYIATGLLIVSVHRNSWILMVLGRVIVGINSGLNAGLVPMYLSEIPPIAWRGAIGSMYQLFITIAILVAEVLSTKWALGKTSSYEFLFYFIGAVGVLQMIVFPLCVDSPKHLYDIGKVEEARKALIWLRGVEDVEREMQELKKSSDAQNELGEFRVMDIFRKSEYRVPLFICCALMISQQLSGINAIIFYSTQIFTKIGIHEDTAAIGTLCIGAVNVFVTIISVVVVDKLGRRPLLLFAFIALFIDTLFFAICSIIVVGPITYRNVTACEATPVPASSLALTTVAPPESNMLAYACIVLAVLFIVFFASGAGSIPWFLISELFLQEARPVGSSIAVATNWTTNFAVGLLFPVVNNKIGPYVWLIFTVCLFISVVYMILFIPETKNRPIEEIVAKYRKTPQEIPATEAPAPAEAE